MTVRFRDVHGLKLLPGRVTRHHPIWMISRPRAERVGLIGTVSASGPSGADRRGHRASHGVAVRPRRDGPVRLRPGRISKSVRPSTPRCWPAWASRPLRWSISRCSSSAAPCCGGPRTTSRRSWRPRRRRSARPSDRRARSSCRHAWISRTRRGRGAQGHARRRRPGSKRKRLKAGEANPPMSSNNVMIGAGGGARGYAPAGFAAGRAAGWRTCSPDAVVRSRALTPS
jgi:hypothetical protein